MERSHPFPPQPVTDQGFTRLLVVSLAPKQYDPHRMVHIRKPHLFAEVPIPATPHAHGFFRLPGNLTRYLLEFLLAPCIDHLPVELQVTHIGAVRPVEVVEDFGTREIAVEREVARDPAPHGIIDE